MANLDGRIVRLGIEIDGRINWYEDLNIYASGTKFASGISNESDIRITNLNKENRDWLMTAVSPYNQNRTDKKVFVQAGRPGKAVYQIFSGTIIRAEISQPPDITISMKARTCSFYNGNIVANSLGQSVQLSAIAQKVASDLNLNLDFQADDKLITNYSYTGGALKQVDYIGQCGGCVAFVDDGSLVVKPKDQHIGDILVVNENTGMVGMPQLDIQGVTVKFLIDSVPRLGGGINVQSKIYPAANGVYQIYKLDYEISNRDTPFYWTARASRPGMGV